MPFWKKRKITKRDPMDHLIKVRGGKSLGLTDIGYPPSKYQPAYRSWQPRAMSRQMSIYPVSRPFSYTGTNKSDFYRWLRDSIPMLSSGVWTWVRLCSTPLKRTLDINAKDKQRAETLLANLDARILETPYGRGSGLSRLVEGCFLELFTTGRFAGELVLTEDEKQIDHFRFIDPDHVSWEHTDKGWTPYIEDENEKKEYFDPERFFYAVQGVDLSNPSGVEPLSCLPFVVEIEQLMLEDMARSGHNAGTPRLQVKVTRPQQFDSESDNDYADRANSYFKDIVAEFRNLEPDDNVFTWNDVEVTIVGTNGQQMAWRLNREQVIEDVITGLRLFPWVLGRSHKTTQNWVQSQFDLLMQMISTHQHSGRDLVDWICNTELKLNGIKGVVTHRFASHPDPFRLERARAKSMEIRNIDFKVQRGYISKDDGAKEMGYVKAFNNE